jgi:hypothetical protein
VTAGARVCVEKPAMKSGRMRKGVAAAKKGSEKRFALGPSASDHRTTEVISEDSNMAMRYPIQYEITPDSVPVGTRWLNVTLQNVGTEDLTMLDVRLNSLDVYALSVYGTGSYIAILKPDEKRVLPFQVLASATASVYVTADGWRDGDPFHWESPGIRVTVGEEAAELVSLFAMTEPYPLLGEHIRCEAAIRAIADSESLTLEFWLETPSGEFEEIATVETKGLVAGEQARYAAEVTPEEHGLYTVYAYLFDGARQIGRELETIFVREE